MKRILISFFPFLARMPKFANKKKTVVQMFDLLFVDGNHNFLNLLAFLYQKLAFCN
jgi:hypothetical protein